MATSKRSQDRVGGSGAAGSGSWSRIRTRHASDVVTAESLALRCLLQPDGSPW
jgi:predicted extracellular nuclease